MKRLSAILPVLIVSASLSATTLIRKDLDALIRESSGIVTGVVTTVNSYRDPNRDVHIQTYVTLSNVEALHGQLSASASNQLVFRIPGGQIDRETVAIPGAPHFTPGDEVIVFVHPNTQTFVPIVGWIQGVFRIVSNSASGGKAVTDHDGNLILGIQGPEVRKENHVRPEASILDSRTGTVRSESDNGGGGIEDDTGQEAKPSTAGGPDFSRAMDASEFIREIARRAALTPTRTIESVAPEELQLKLGAVAPSGAGKPDERAPGISDGDAAAGVDPTPVPPKPSLEESRPDQQ